MHLPKKVENSNYLIKWQQFVDIRLPPGLGLRVVKKQNATTLKWSKTLKAIIFSSRGGQLN